MPDTNQSMRPLAMTRSLPALVMALSTACLVAGSAMADEVDYLALDEASKRAIRSACGSWAYRDADQWIAPWLETVAPLCTAAARAAGPRPSSPRAGNTGRVGP